MTREIDFDAIVENAEKEFVRKSWEKVDFLMRQEERDPLDSAYLEEEIDKIINEIEKEKERVNPSTAIDHEEVWRATGKYITCKRKHK